MFVSCSLWNRLGDIAEHALGAVDWSCNCVCSASGLHSQLKIYGSGHCCCSHDNGK